MTVNLRKKISAKITRTMIRVKLTTHKNLNKKSTQTSIKGKRAQKFRLNKLSRINRARQTDQNNLSRKYRVTTGWTRQTDNNCNLRRTKSAIAAEQILPTSIWGRTNSAKTKQEDQSEFKKRSTKTATRENEHNNLSSAMSAQQIAQQNQQKKL